MAKGTVNKVILIGRLGADPELRHTPSGAAVANFNIATNRVWKDSDGEKQEDTEWHKIVVWGKTAEIANSYAKKGSRVYVEGRLQTRDWEDNEGQKRYVTEVVCESLQLLDSKAESNGTPAQAGQTDMLPPEKEKPPVASADTVPF